MIIDTFWDDEFKYLDYAVEEFNNREDVDCWIKAGYSNKFTGAMCDMRKKQPSWNYKFIRHFNDLGWKDVCTSYYRMDTGTILPVHQDTYKRYIELHNLQDHKNLIQRAVVFLEPWASGHYLELNGIPIVGWLQGFYVTWEYDTPHMAANLGLTPRYTLQLTGHL